MPFIRAKLINGEEYFYLVRSERVAGTVYQKTVRYLGGRAGAATYATENGLAMPPERALPSFKFPDLDSRIGALKQKWNSLQPLPREVGGKLREDLKLLFTYNSTAIEGSSLNLLETKEILECDTAVGGKPLRDYLAAKGHAEAVELMYSLSEKKKPLASEKEILAFHSKVVGGVVDALRPAGRYRDTPVYIIGSPFTPPPAEQVPGMMRKLVAGLNSNPERLDPVALAARAHFDFESIHPFADGNGRVGRLLSNLVLLRAGFVPLIIEKRERKKYFGLLGAAQKSGDPGGVIRFFKLKEIKSLEFHLSQAT
ncbi:Fic/DOC family protein [uncultured archaeon]|nr:Fic/DOC family protein [uncultured archaeon]